MNNENHLIMEVPKVDTKYKDKLFRMIFPLWLMPN